MSTLLSLSDASTPDSHLSRIAKVLVAQGTATSLVVKSLNTRGMRFYKLKDWHRAAVAFERACEIDPTAELPTWNRASVAGLQNDALGAVRWLRKLKVLDTAKAKKYLRWATKDKDFDPVRGDPVFRAFFAGR